ncbi:MAG: DNA-3-methyladenine glycosylase [Candidatus Hydrogenedentes bacterium]|nr:DNA-3-methyladenine glycosylase [Candidatus Hydrogenedentota bacterium]
MARKLPQSFYHRDTLDVARDLIGKCLVHAQGDARFAGIITETEAYCGPHDLACHASKGKTKRTEVMFGPPGHWYVYLIYGMYHCLNIVTEREHYPAAVLIRGVHPVTGLDHPVKTDGPGKLCRAFAIDRALNTTPAFGRSAVLWIEDRGIVVPEERVQVTTRVGIDYAKEYRDKPWRFLVDGGALPP